MKTIVCKTIQEAFRVAFEQCKLDCLPAGSLAELHFSWLVYLPSAGSEPQGGSGKPTRFEVSLDNYNPRWE